MLAYRYIAFFLEISVFDNFLQKMSWKINIFQQFKNLKKYKIGKNFNVVMKNWKTFFFCGIWDHWAANHDMAVILQILGLWPLKKIQKKIFHFYEFFLKIWYKKGQKSCIFNEKLKNCFFSEVHPIFWSYFLRWCTVERPKMIQNS